MIHTSTWWAQQRWNYEAHSRRGKKGLKAELMTRSSDIITQQFMIFCYPSRLSRVSTAACSPHHGKNKWNEILISCTSKTTPFDFFFNKYLQNARQQWERVELVVRRSGWVTMWRGLQFAQWVIMQKILGSCRRVVVVIVVERISNLLELSFTSRSRPQKPQINLRNWTFLM